MKTIANGNARRLRIAIVAKVGDLARDDRIRKEVLRLKQLAELEIFVVFNDNSARRDATFEGITVRSIALATRRVFPSRRLLLIKALEFYCRVAPKVRDFDYVWCHEKYTILFPLLLGRVKVIWDLHELPVDQPTRIEKTLYQALERGAHRLIHANSFRQEFLFEHGVFCDPSKHFALRNFPDACFYEAHLETAQTKLARKWLAGADYVYLQGLGMLSRFPYNSVASLLEATEYKVIVVGPMHSGEKAKLEKKYGTILDSRVFFVGSVPQLATPGLMRSARFSMIFYDAGRPNNRFCEPNRLFQALGLGVPVIVGRNEPMAEVVRNVSAGVVMDTDGHNFRQIVSAIRKMEANYMELCANAEKCSGTLLWNSDDVIAQVIA